MTLELVTQNKIAGGWHKQYTHVAKTLGGCNMRFAIYLPPQASSSHPVPVVYWLSGLTCTDENFMQKAGALKMAAELGIAIVAPDTSPRGEGVPDDENGSYDFGLGAGFYLNATQAPWNQHYHMYDYIVDELPALIEATFPVSSQRAIAGHSMGGHGALTIAFKNAERYSSVSAFSPICNPMDCPCGQKAFSNYLGNDRTMWEAYDASVLFANAESAVPVLVDQGEADQYLAEQLKPETLEAAAKRGGHTLTLNRHEGYDHSYYFISSFIDEHLRFHAQFFKGL